MEDGKDGLKFSERLKELRSRAGLTQREFAERIGVVPATLSTYETVAKTPSIEIVYKIAKEFNVSIDWLCGLEVKKDNTTYADVFKSFYEFIHALNLEYQVEVQNFNNSLLNRYNVYIRFNDSVVFNFLEGLSKMNKLLIDKIIDQNLFDLWFEQQLKDNSKEIYLMNSERSNISGMIEDTDDLPF